MRDAINNNPVVQIVSGRRPAGDRRRDAGCRMLLHKKDSGASGGGGRRPPRAPSSRPRRARSTSRRGLGRAERPRGERSDRGPGDGRRAVDRNRRPRPLVPGPGLPRPVVTAWHRGDTIVLLIVREGGIDDRLVRHSVEALSGPGHGVFITRAKGIARYSADHPGSRRNQVPALVVVRPRRLSGSAAAGTAQLRLPNSQAVVQAVHDALLLRQGQPAVQPEVSGSPMRELPDYLRPLPGPNEGSAASEATARAAQPEDSGVPGLIRPMQRGHSGAFITDVHRRPRLRHPRAGRAGDRGRPAPPAGAPEALLLEQGAIDARPALARGRRALRPRPRRPLHLPRRHGRREPDLGQDRRAATRRCRSASSTRRRCWSRWPTRPTCLPSTTSRSPPGSTAASRSPPRTTSKR